MNTIDRAALQEKSEDVEGGVAGVDHGTLGEFSVCTCGLMNE